MRTLAKPTKTKKIQKDSQKQPQKKAQSRKITKTVFSSPFCYKIQALQHEDMDQLKSDFLPYLKRLRQQMPKKPESNVHKKFISFQPSQNAIPTLTSPQLILGVKSCIRSLSKPFEGRPHLFIIFYEQNRQQMLQELFCRLLKEKMPIIVARNDQHILDSLVVKTVTCIGLRDEQISQKLLKLSMKCGVEIPWLVQKKWIGLNDD